MPPMPPMPRAEAMRAVDAPFDEMTYWPLPRADTWLLSVRAVLPPLHDRWESGGACAPPAGSRPSNPPHERSV